MHFVIRDISMFSVNNYELSERKAYSKPEIADESVGTNGPGLTSYPICAIILARDAPGSISQEPTVRIGWQS